MLWVVVEGFVPVVAPALVVAAGTVPVVTATVVPEGVLVPFKQVVGPKPYEKTKSIKGKHHIPF